MPLRMSRLAILIAAVALSGCEANTVRSQRPLFTKADAVGAPAWAPGVWSSADPGCEYDRDDPFDGWPDCSNAIILGRGGTAAAPDAILAGGDPLILQDGGARAGAPELYWYKAIRPLRYDAKGRMVEAEAWSVFCGPPQPPPSPAELARETPEQKTARQITRSPLPGVTMNPGDQSCLATDPAVVRTAAAASRVWATPRILKWERTARWWRGENLPNTPGGTPMFGDEAVTWKGSGAPRGAAPSLRR